MSKKFRTGLFGFNRDDVLQFVLEAKENESKSAKKIDGLTQKTAELENVNNELQEKCNALDTELSAAKAEIAEFHQREEALTRLSESIGRLYLVAQANARSIIDTANRSAELSLSSVEKNMAVAVSAEEKLEEISAVLSERTKTYLAEIEELKNQISATQVEIEQNTVEISERQNEAESVASGVNS